jgi:hypothetical protein
MKKSQRLIVFTLLLGALLLSACSGAAPSQDDSSQAPSGSQVTEVVFTGSVESMGGGQWTISGQSVSVDGSTALDANIQVGDIVTVEAQVSQDGKVFALKIESSLSDDDAAANANDANANDANANMDDDTNTGDDNGNANSNDDNSNTNANGDDNSAPAGPEQEILGAVQAITKDTITIDGVTYQLANFTEFKTPIVVGDQVKIHLIVNADGTFTIREIEKTTGTGITINDNGNSNDDSSNSNSNGDDSNSNDNSNDDNSGDDSNSNDDDSSGDNSNDDDGGDDDNSNDNG